MVLDSLAPAFTLLTDPTPIQKRALALLARLSGFEGFADQKPFIIKHHP
jgi:hypothetical protein